MAGIKTRGSGASRGVPAGGSGAGADGWEDAPTEFTRRTAFIDIYGDTGTGRTRLALTAPGPIALAHTAEKIDGLVQQFALQKKVRMLNFGGNFTGTEQQIVDLAAATWGRMTAGWRGAGAWARSVIMDTASEGWELIRLARFGTLKPKGRVDNLYGPVNAEWRSLFKAYRGEDSTVNVITIHQTKEEYLERFKGGEKVSARTGRTIRAGMKEMSFMPDVVIRTSKYAGIFTATIEKGWWAADKEGTEFTNEDARLPFILSYLTDTPESEW